MKYINFYYNIIYKYMKKYTCFFTHNILYIYDDDFSNILLNYNLINFLYCKFMLFSTIIKYIFNICLNNK
ncbi:hypothetical protein PFBG_05552 [Plasmodium falciparum 7G8]|uniref:Uncharacterized protein n=2 Tax=Plasmodium falciparum TaxID=5833 RepID=A0A024X0Z3_PLAFC|nr:hypothetical protein PFMC_05561 [Plasmodium falciparum CAMP/Malaysia]EUR62948.1 hypothetical protein PFBG_05552 [Plasmodium falciparum 7G8]